MAEVLFFHLSSVIESNVPYVERSGIESVVIGLTASVYSERCCLQGAGAVDIGSFSASSEYATLGLLNEVRKFEIRFFQSSSVLWYSIFVFT